ncbi:MAG: 4-hydroxythreonine-4-phosphate dehydrogenase, partial [Leptolyngbya sp. RL_3_1]|nr:4-hydroxythreonine-4-phosphate dehydrogenase [Leptolyngbya sp. RL_3_1]
MAKALGDPRVRQGVQITVIGEASLLGKAGASLLALVDRQEITLQSPPRSAGQAAGEAAVICPGVPTPTTGHLSFCWLQAAIAGAITGQFDAIVTGPIAKSVWHQAGHDYPGQTEVLAEGAG